MMARCRATGDTVMGKTKLSLRPIALGAVSVVLLATAAAEASGRAPAHPAPAHPTAVMRPHVVAPRPSPAKPAASAAIGQRKLRNRDQGSFAQPIAGSAWQALGFQKRFLKVGDAWSMAWSSRKRFSILKRALTAQDRAAPKWAAPVVVHYRVSKVITQDLGGHKRQVATITSVYGDQVRGRMQTGNELKVDQYFNPVERCAFTKWTPFGTCRDRDTRSVIRSMGAVPFFIGDLERLPARPAQPLPMAPVFRAQLARVNGKKSFLHVPVHSGRRKYADTFWAAGDLVPTYVLGDNVQGVLIGQRLTR